MRGTDQCFSMEPRGIELICEDTKKIRKAIGRPDKVLLPEEECGFRYKQGRAIHVVKDIRAGEILSVDNIGLKAPAEGPPPYEFGKYLGKIAVCDLSTTDTLSPEAAQDVRPMGDL